MNELGIDLSSNEAVTGDGRIVYPDFGQMAAAGVAIATVRIMAGGVVDRQGVTMVDTLLNDPLRPGIKPIPYAWTRLSSPGSVLPQLKPLLAAWKWGTDLTFMLDLEDYGNYVGWLGMAKEVDAYLAGIEAVSGGAAIVYSNRSFPLQYMTKEDAKYFYKRSLILAAPDAYPIVPLPFTRPQLIAHQYTFKASAPFYGIKNGALAASLYEFYR
jgi:hypothetical protein